MLSARSHIYGIRSAGIGRYDIVHLHFHEQSAHGGKIVAESPRNIIGSVGRMLAQIFHYHPLLRRKFTEIKCRLFPGGSIEAPTKLRGNVGGIPHDSCRITGYQIVAAAAIAVGNPAGNSAYSASIIKGKTGC